MNDINKAVEVKKETQTVAINKAEYETLLARLSALEDNRISSLGMLMPDWFLLFNYKKRNQSWNAVHKGAKKDPTGIFFKIYVYSLLSFFVIFTVAYSWLMLR